MDEFAAGQRDGYYAAIVDLFEVLAETTNLGPVAISETARKLKGRMNEQFPKPTPPVLTPPVGLGTSEPTPWPSGQREPLLVNSEG